MIPMLTKTDIEQPRTQAALRAWVKELHEKFGETKEGRRAVRLNEGDLVKQFVEEIWPLALFADAFYKGRADVLFKPIIGHQPYDALILEASTGKTLHYLEVTQSFDGYQEYLRMHHLQEFGHAPVPGKELRRDPKTKRVPESFPDCVNPDEERRKAFERILGAIQNKSAKRYESRTSLIVEIEDYYMHSDADRDALDNFTLSFLLGPASNFAALYLLSDRKRLALAYPKLQTTK